ncbi:OsmC family protein [Haliea atlantica]|nr:osmotically inducible protein OsmC [Haliea sp.]MAL96125.1 osmotically inducible protein OsmC [Haliea sp.]|tara:strand:+ start:54261 stop:54695 length:435 start_codon:yes stop_codon:yes gene_type:complete
MQDFPHHYRVHARGSSDGPVRLEGDKLPVLETTPPPEFGGPEGYWSPESLLLGAVADCFILTFRAVASASRLTWTSLECDATGTLDRVERVTRFTAVTVAARLSVPEGSDPEKARRVLEKAEAACLITSSMNAEVHLEADVTVA